MRWGRVERFTIGALAYLGLSAVWIYGVLDRGVMENAGSLFWIVLAVVTAAHVAFGFAIRERAAVLLPIAVVLLAIPAGYPESRYSEPGPLWFGQMFLVLFEIPLIAVGLGLRSLVEWRRAAARSS